MNLKNQYNSSFLKRKAYPHNGYEIPWTIYLPTQEALIEWEEEIIDTNYVDNVTYSMNEFGFRSPDFKKDKSIFLFNGCSFTFGTGILLEKTWPYLVSSEFKKEAEYLNIGLPASGPDIQILNLHWAIDNFKIDKIFWYMSDPFRQVIHYNYGHYDFYVPNSKSKFFNNHKTTENFINLSIDLEKNIYIKTYWQLYSLFSKIADKKIDSYITCWIEDFDNDIVELKTKFNIKNLGMLNSIDFARDNTHPGNLSHCEFSKKILRNL